MRLIDMNNNYLVHHGIKGQKWGIRRFQKSDGSLTNAGKKRRSYYSTGIRSAIAKVQNRKVDKGFEKWKEGSKNRENAIDLGKIANQKRLIYESDKTNKQAKIGYKQANREYKKALNANTTYRKGQVRGEVGSDLSRKYLSEAKKVEKKLNQDPSNRKLQKQYSDLMSKHDIERAKARRAPSVGAARSRRIATTKAMVTKTAKAAIASAALAVGAKAFQKYIAPKINYSVSSEEVQEFVKKGASYLKYMY